MRLPLRALLLAYVAVGGCATPRPAAPPPSELSGARWWNGTGFGDAPRYVAGGRFHPRPARTSEGVSLPALYAVPLAPGDCDRRPVRASALWPVADALVPGRPADFYLAPSDPRAGASPAVAFVCRGQLVEP